MLGRDARRSATHLDGRVSFARSNFVQLGHVSGHITVAGRRFEVGSEWVGARDHSWGIGETGTGNRPDVAAPTAGAMIQGPRWAPSGCASGRWCASRPAVDLLLVPPRRPTAR